MLVNHVKQVKRITSFLSTFVWLDLFKNFVWFPCLNIHLGRRLWRQLPSKRSEGNSGKSSSLIFASLKGTLSILTHPENAKRCEKSSKHSTNSNCLFLNKVPKLASEAPSRHNIFVWILPPFKMEILAAFSSQGNVKQNYIQQQPQQQQQQPRRNARTVFKQVQYIEVEWFIVVLVVVVIAGENVPRGQNHVTFCKFGEQNVPTLPFFPTGKMLGERFYLSDD